MKRQLNVNTIKANPLKGFRPFGFFIHGIEIEWHMKFDKESGCQMCLIQIVSLLTTFHAFSNIRITISLLLALRYVIMMILL